MVYTIKLHKVKVLENLILWQKLKTFNTLKKIERNLVTNKSERLNRNV